MDTINIGDVHQYNGERWVVERLDSKDLVLHNESTPWQRVIIGRTDTPNDSELAKKINSAYPKING